MRADKIFIPPQDFRHEFPPSVSYKPDGGYAKRVRKARKRLAKFQIGDVVLDAGGRVYQIVEYRFAKPTHGSAVPVEEIDFPALIVAREGDAFDKVVK